MTLDERASALLAHLATLNGFDSKMEPDYGDYKHMGATISAAILQAGLNWESTVQPRIERLNSAYPEAATTTGFLNALDKLGYTEILRWQDAEKPRRIVSLARLLKAEGVETEDELKRWLLRPESDALLRQLKGVGDKTIDFLKILVRIPTSAVDRHLENMLLAAGVPSKGYHEIHETIDRAADLAGINRIVFDFSIWRFMSGKAKDRRRTKKLP